MEIQNEYVCLSDIAKQLNMKSTGNANYWVEKLGIKPVGKMGLTHLYEADVVEQVREAREESQKTQVVKEPVKNGSKKEKACDHLWAKIWVDYEDDTYSVVVMCAKCLELKRVIAEV
jgi:hypothetical protein